MANRQTSDEWNTLPISNGLGIHRPDVLRHDIRSGVIPPVCVCILRHNLGCKNAVETGLFQPFRKPPAPQNKSIIESPVSALDATSGIVADLMGAGISIEINSI